MTVVNFKGKGGIVANANFVGISPVDRDVAVTLFRLAENNIRNQYWVKKHVLDEVLAGLGKEGLEARLLAEKNPLKMNSAQFAKEFPTSAIYIYNAEEESVRVTPTPFGTSSDVQKYFAIKSPEYVGR